MLWQNDGVIRTLAVFSRRGFRFGANIGNDCGIGSFFAMVAFAPARRGAPPISISNPWVSCPGAVRFRPVLAIPFAV